MYFPEAEPEEEPAEPPPAAPRRVPRRPSGGSSSLGAAACTFYGKEPQQTMSFSSSTAERQCSFLDFNCDDFDLFAMPKSVPYTEESMSVRPFHVFAPTPAEAPPLPAEAPPLPFEPEVAAPLEDLYCPLFDVPYSADLFDLVDWTPQVTSKHCAALTVNAPA